MALQTFMEITSQPDGGNDVEVVYSLNSMAIVGFSLTEDRYQPISYIAKHFNSLTRFVFQIRPILTIFEGMLRKFIERNPLTCPNFYERHIQSFIEVHKGGLLFKRFDPRDCDRMM